jgi:hypothetical protein
LVAIMRRAPFCPVLFVPVLSVLFVPACFSLPKADVSTRVIDDFAYDGGLDAATSLTWGAFAPWTCDAINLAEADGGSIDTASPLLGPDGGPPVTCTVGPGQHPDLVDAHALLATFALNASTRTLGVAVTTHTMSGAVDLSAFQTLQFYAWLRSPTHPLPEGTQLEVELGCPTNPTMGPPVDFVADQIADTVVAGAAGWGNQVGLKLIKFLPVAKGAPNDGGPAPSEVPSACLRTIGSISFIVILPPATSPIAGTLYLDGIEVTTKPQ